MHMILFPLLEFELALPKHSIEIILLMKIAYHVSLNIQS